MARGKESGNSDNKRAADAVAVAIGGASNSDNGKKGRQQQTKAGYNYNV